MSYSGRYHPALIPPAPMPGEALVLFECECCGRQQMRLTLFERVPLVCSYCASDERYARTFVERIEFR